LSSVVVFVLSLITGMALVTYTNRWLSARQ